KQYTGKTVIDATGMAVTPGFVNTHTHVPMTLFRGIADDRELMDWLRNFIFPAEAKNVDRDFVKWGTRLAAAEMIRSGTATFADRCGRLRPSLTSRSSSTVPKPQTSCARPPSAPMA